MVHNPQFLSQFNKIASNSPVLANKKEQTVRKLFGHQGGSLEQIKVTFIRNKVGYGNDYFFSRI